MRKMKRIASLMLAMLLMLAVCSPVSTENVEAAGNYSITINNSVEGYTYYAYQIFVGDYDTSTGILSNIEWGDGVDSSSLLQAIVDLDSSSILYGYFTGITTSSTAQDLAKILAASPFSGSNTDYAIAFAELVQSYIIDTSKIEIEYDSTNLYYRAGGLDAGYYLVVNTAVPDGEDNTVYSRYICG